MEIIDTTYFIGKINLPQIGTSDGNEEVQSFIETYEPEFLQKLLGYDLWKAFSDGISGSGPYAQRWNDLLNGKEFTYGGRNYKWTGFLNKPSSIAQYVYYQFQEYKAQSTTLVGDAAPKTANAQRVNPIPKMIDAWNAMVENNRLLAAFLNASVSVYPEWQQMRDWRVPGSYWKCSRNEVFNFKNALDI